MSLRGFERVVTADFPNAVIPRRKTRHSAGYDISAAVTVEIAPKAVALVPTGIKAYMQSDEYLGLHIRSGLAVKQSLMLVNGQGIVDCDYYDNSDNEGHIMIAVINMGVAPAVINAGDRIAQGIFYKYLLADDDQAYVERTGGFGSTGHQ